MDELKRLVYNAKSCGLICSDCPIKESECYFLLPLSENVDFILTHIAPLLADIERRGKGIAPNHVRSAVCEESEFVYNDYYCGKCDKSVEKNHRYCPSCGTKIAWKEANQ